MQRGKRLHARADHIGNEVEPRRRELVGSEVEVHRFAMVSPSWSHTDLRGAHSKGNGRRWSRDVIPVGRENPSRTDPAQGEAGRERIVGSADARDLLCDGRQGGPKRGPATDSTPASHALAQGALPARSVPGPREAVAGARCVLAVASVPEVACSLRKMADDVTDQQLVDGWPRPYACRSHWRAGSYRPTAKSGATRLYSLCSSVITWRASSTSSADSRGWSLVVRR